MPGYRSVIIIFLIVFSSTLLISVYDSFAYNFAEKSGLEATGRGTGHTKLGITSQIKNNPGRVIGVFLKAILSFLGIVFLILMIYGGFTWMMARGSEQEVTKAKNIIINGTIGLIVVLLAYALTTFVGNLLMESVAPS